MTYVETSDSLVSETRESRVSTEHIDFELVSPLEKANHSDWEHTLKQ